MKAVAMYNRVGTGNQVDKGNSLTEQIKRVAAYIRVSTEEQAEKGNSLAEQKQRLAAYCIAMGWDEPIFFVDDGYSAKDMNRPELKKLMKLVEEKHVLKIMVTKLDRMSRRLLDLLTFIDLLQSNDVSFVSTSESFDTDTPSGRLTLQVLGAVAEFERERIRERVMDNMISLAKNTDKALTLPCYGYDLAEGRYQINESEAENIRFMFDLAERGHGHRMIAKQLNLKGATTKRGKPWDQVNVKRLMNTETIEGIMIYNKRQKIKGKMSMRDKVDWIVKENNHPAIIPPDRFQNVQDIFRSRSRAHKHAENESYLLTGLVKCKYCGGNMKGSTSRNKTKYNEYTYYRYICSSYVSGYGCKYNAVHRDDLENEIIEHVKWIISASESDVKINFSISQTAEEEIKDIKMQMFKINKRMQKQIEAYEKELISADDLKQARERIDAERLTLNQQLEKSSSQGGDLQQLKQNAARLIDDITGIDRIKAKTAVRMLIDNILVEGNLISVTWKA